MSPRIVVIKANGAERELKGQIGMTLMEVLRDAGIDEILAICGGACSCATCHIHVEGGPAQCLPAMQSDEDDLLDGSFHRSPTSRLSCQIPLTERLDGLRIRVVSET